MVTWKHPRHWASVWSRGRAERARQRAAASRLRGAVHVPCTSTVSARRVLRARRSRAGIGRIGARSGPAAHQHAWSRPTTRPPAGSPRSTPCTNPTPTTAAVVVVVDGRARARSRLYSAAHRVPSTTATRQAVALRARAAGAPAAATYKPTRRLRAIWVQLAARAERAGHRCRSRAGDAVDVCLWQVARIADFCRTAAHAAIQVPCMPVHDALGIS